jgi:hypothetical protein
MAEWSGGDLRTIDGVEPHRHGFGQRCPAGVEPVGHLHRQQIVEHHQLAIAARIFVRVAHRVHPRGVEGHRPRHDDVAEPRVGDVVAQLDDLGRELVTHDDISGQVHDLHGGTVGSGLAPGLGRHLHHQVAVGEGVEVGAADATGQGAHQDLSGAGPRLGDIVDDQRTPAHHCCVHGAPSFGAPLALRHRIAPAPRE